MEMGYMAGISGAPDVWLAEVSPVYREASEHFQSGRDMHTITLLAEAMLASQPSFTPAENPSA
jgi:hypothetical protein